MCPHIRIVIGSLITISVIMILILGLHVGGVATLAFGIYSPLLGAFIGGGLTLVSTYTPVRHDEHIEPWAKYEKLSWTLIGAGCIAWGIGECFWRYYIAHGESPFPSLADIGYASFLPLVFPGLLLQKGSINSTSRRVFLVLDSLIATGVLLSIGWFLLLGPLAQSPAQSLLAKFLGLYYAMADITLLSSQSSCFCVGTPRKIRCGMHAASASFWLGWAWPFTQPLTSPSTLFKIWAYQ